MKNHIQLSKIATATTATFKSEEEAKEELESGLSRLADLQEMLFAESQRSLLVIFQGMDTSGKDSMIKHVMTGMNPQGCDVHSFKTPSVEENRHDYLRRYMLALPEHGKIGIFNRSYYEDVTIVRVHQPKTKMREWQRRFDEINNFEKYLTENGYTILKFFLHISREEQRKRLLKRIEDPNKHWKFDVSDIREREYWKDYQRVYEDAINHTNKANAPWIILPSDLKWSARLSVANSLVKTLEKMKPRFPKLSATGETQLKKARKLLSRE